VCRVPSACFFSRVRPRPGSARFPYTTLFRSQGVGGGQFAVRPVAAAVKDIVGRNMHQTGPRFVGRPGQVQGALGVDREGPRPLLDRKSTRLNSSHVKISYAVFCLKKKKTGAQ